MGIFTRVTRALRSSVDVVVVDPDELEVTQQLARGLQHHGLDAVVRRQPDQVGRAMLYWRTSGMSLFTEALGVESFVRIRHDDLQRHTLPRTEGATWIVDCEQARTSLEQQGGTAGASQLIYPTCDLRRLAPCRVGRRLSLRKVAGVPAGAMCVGLVGYEPQQHALLAATLRQTHEREKSLLVLLPHEDTCLLDELRVAGVPGHTLAPPPGASLEHLYDVALSISPQHWRGVLRCWAARIPVVAGRGHFAEEQLNDGENALLMETTANELARGLLEICDQPELGHQVAAGGLQVVEQFTPEAQLSRWVACLAEPRRQAA